MLLHESNIFPVVYIPKGDVSMELFTKTDHTTHCPFQGRRVVLDNRRRRRSCRKRGLELPNTVNRIDG